jgi:quinol monooxygenase YgiN
MAVVIAGFVDIDPDRRDEALRGAERFIAGALTQAGCVHYAWTADVLTPGRIYVFEEWTSQDALAAHLAGPHYRAMLGHMQQFAITNAVTEKYRVDLSEPVYDPSGTPRADFFTAKS